jgi:hypothetical protein
LQVRFLPGVLYLLRLLPGIRHDNGGRPATASARQEEPTCKDFAPNVERLACHSTDYRKSNS